MTANEVYKDDHENFVTAHTPLLGEFPDTGERASLWPAPRPRCYVLVLVLGIVFATELASSVSKAPLIRVFESIICREYYERANPKLLFENRNIDEQQCKNAAVQQELALLRGWRDFYDYLPGLFLAIPFGMVADRYGRKWLSLLNVLSAWLRVVWIYFVCAFPHMLPIRMVWAQSILGILGGGPSVASALLMVIMTDVTPEEKRANVFFYAHAALCATEFFGPPIGSVLMDRNPWIALLVAFALLTITIPLALALPETFHKLQDRRGSLQGHSQRPSSSEKALGTSFTLKLRSILPSLGFLVADYRIGLILFASISIIFGQACINLGAQYTSRRYGWTISQAAYLSSVKAAIMLIALLGLFPLASNYLLSRKSFTTFKKDVLLLRISFTIVTLGLFIEGAASTIAVFIVGCCITTIGMGASALIRSLLSSLVGQDEIGRLFAVISLIWTSAMLIASPTVATLFSEGLQGGGTWSGLPFLFTGLLFTVATTALWMSRLGGPTTAQHEAHMREEEEEEELERENARYLQPVSWNSRTPGLRTSTHLSPRSTGRMGRSPSLVVDPCRRPSKAPSLTTPLGTPLFSPGLRIVDAHGAF